MYEKRNLFSFSATDTNLRKQGQAIEMMKEQKRVSQDKQGCNWKQRVKGASTEETKQEEKQFFSRLFLLTSQLKGIIPSICVSEG